ncbi:MAG: lactate/malate family dehydrogenase [Ilumatobacteraceae bacterium]
MKLSIIGAGTVGTAVAYAAAIRGVADEIALVARDAAKAPAEVLDLRHGLQFVPSTSVLGGDDLDVCEDSDVIVITAGAKQRPGQSRLDLAADNVAMSADLVPRLVESSPGGIVLVVTNPVDVVTFAAQEVAARHAVDPARVIGSGTVLDTSRLRLLLAERLDVAIPSIHATIVGEHGDSEFALWSSATVGGAPLSLDADERSDLLEQVRGAAYRIIEGKGATNLAIGLSTARILEAIRDDEHAVLPVSSRHAIDGVGPVCLSLPTVVGRHGVVRSLDVPMSDDEQDALVGSARAIRDAIDSVIGRAIGG